MLPHWPGDTQTDRSRAGSRGEREQGDDRAVCGVEQMLAADTQHELAADGDARGRRGHQQDVGAKEQAEREAGDERASDPRVAAKTDNARAGELGDDRSAERKADLGDVSGRSRGWSGQRRSSPASTAI